MASLRKLTPKAASTAIITAQMDVRLSNGHGHKVEEALGSTPMIIFLMQLDA